MGTTHTPRIAIVGAGFGGLATAFEFTRSGIDSFVIFERADRVGGVWRENTYPGAGCDVPSPFYSFSYAPNPAWPHRFARQEADRKSTRLNSSHANISYAVFCLKKNNTITHGSASTAPSAAQLRCTFSLSPVVAAPLPFLFLLGTLLPCPCPPTRSSRQCDSFLP